MAKKKEGRLDIRIDADLKEEFLKYLEEMGFTQSGWITRKIKEELEQYKKKEAE